MQNRLDIIAEVTGSNPVPPTTGMSYIMMPYLKELVEASLFQSNPPFNPRIFVIL